MKRLTIVAIGLGLVLAGATGADAQDYWTTPGLEGTPHDFSTATAVDALGPSAGLCTFCHTPHRATAQQLIWNRTIGGPWNFSVGAATVGGTNLTGFTGTWGGPSPKCLSCHDGVAVIGNVNWFDASGPVSFVGTNAPGDFTVTNVMSSNRRVGELNNLDDNHPVGVPFPATGGGGIRNYNGSTQGSSVGTVDFKTPTEVFTNGIILYEDRGGDVVQRLTALAQATDQNKVGIECSSCHEPHNRGQDGGKFFLRGDYNGSALTYICLKCHSK